MRKAPRAILLAFLAFLSSVLIGVAAVMTAAVTLAATALIVPGTGTHNINDIPIYQDNARDRYINPAATTPPFECTSTNGCVLTGIPYPASFWPIPIPGWCPGLSCDTWNVSVATGVTNLNAQLIEELTHPTPENQQIILFGYSQGGQVVTNEMYNLAGLDPATKERIQVVTIGNIGNPQGLWSRFNFLPGLTVPILNVTFGPQLPTNIGIKSTNYVFEYDPVGDAPLNWWNGLAILNALAAFNYVHGNYLVPNENDPTGALPYGYTPGPTGTLATTIDSLLSNCTEGPGSNCRTYQDAKFVLIPWQGTLPLLQPAMDLANATGTTAIVKPLADLIQPALKVLIDLGYDRNANPGIPRTLNLIPIFNPIKLAVDLVVAAGEGIQAFIHDITGTTSSTPAPIAPPGPVSTFAAVDDTTVRLAQTEQKDATDEVKVDPNASLRRSTLGNLSQTDPLKVDPKPEADGNADVKPEAEVKPDNEADGSANTVFTLPKPTKPAPGSTTAPKRPKLDNPIARVIDLFRPKPRGTQNGQTATTGTDTKTDPGAGQQQGGPPSSSDNGQAAA